jgi:hypothetical protein
VLCKFESQIIPVQSGEFHDLVSLLETHGFLAVHVKKGKEQHRDKCASLSVSTDEVTKAIENSPLLVSIMDSGAKALSKMRD